MSRSACLLALTALLACQPPAPPPTTVAEWTGAVDLVLGGSGEPSGPYLFEEIRGLHLGRDGEILVTEHGGSQLRLFDASGALLAVGGTAGGMGPGDLTDICCGTLTDDGRILVREDGALRYSVFRHTAPRLTFVEHVRMPFNSPLSFEPLRWDSAGHLIDLSAIRLPDHAISGWQRAFLTTTGAVHRVDTIAPPPDDVIEVYRHTGTVGGMSFSGTYYSQYGPSPLVAVGPGGEYAEGLSTHYAITWLDATGQRLALLESSGDGPLITPSEREAADSRDSVISARIGARLPFRTPERKPVLLRIGFDLDGRLWVQRNVPQGTPRRADVWDRSGRQIATVTWPANVQLMGWVIRGDTGLGIQTDDHGEERVVRLVFH